MRIRSYFVFGRKYVGQVKMKRLLKQTPERKRGRENGINKIRLYLYIKTWIALTLSSNRLSSKRKM